MTYAHPEALVSTDWVAEHLNDPNVRLLEVDVDTTSLREGPHPGAIGWNWQTDLQDRVRRDVVDPRTFAELCRRAASRNDDTVVLYGDNNNWFAAWAFWQYKYHGHKDVRLMNGGRKKWELEKRAADHRGAAAQAQQLPIPAERRIDPRLSPGSRWTRSGSNRINLVDVRRPTNTPARSSPRPA